MVQKVNYHWLIQLCPVFEVYLPKVYVFIDIHIGGLNANSMTFIRCLSLRSILYSR